MLHEAWNEDVLRALPLGYRLVLRWCDYLDFEDVVCIDHESLFEWNFAYRGKATRLSQVVFGNGSLPMVVVPTVLVNDTQAFALQRAAERGFESRRLIFEQANGEPITRASLCAALGRALELASGSRRLNPLTSSLDVGNMPVTTERGKR